MNNHTKQLARCRWCDRNDRPVEAMAIYSFKQSYGGFTGVCKDCFNDPAAEARYHRRMDARQNQPPHKTTSGL